MILVRNFRRLWWPLVVHDSRITAGHRAWRWVNGERSTRQKVHFSSAGPPVGNDPAPDQGIGGDEWNRAPASPPANETTAA